MEQQAEEMATQVQMLTRLMGDSHDISNGVKLTESGRE